MYSLTWIVPDKHSVKEIYLFFGSLSPEEESKPMHRLTDALMGVAAHGGIFKRPQTPCLIF